MDGLNENEIVELNRLLDFLLVRINKIRSRLNEIRVQRRMSL